MANRCWTSIRITGPKDQLDRLDSVYKKAEACESTSFPSHTSLMKAAGISEEKIDGTFRRGATIYYDYDGVEIRLDQDDAWEPCFDPLLAVISKLDCKDVEINYLALEPGGGLFETNDDDYIGKYLVDAWNTEEIPDSFKKYDYDFISADELKHALDEWKIPSNKVSLDQHLSAFLFEFGDYVSINKIEYEPVMAIG